MQSPKTTPEAPGERFGYFDPTEAPPKQKNVSQRLLTLLQGVVVRGTPIEQLLPVPMFGVTRADAFNAGVEVRTLQEQFYSDEEWRSQLYGKSSYGR